MFKISDLPELVADYESGEADWPLAYSVLLRLVGDHEVSEVMSKLSAEMATRFDESLRKEFGDEELARTGLWIDNAGGEPANRDLIVTRVRQWITVGR